MKTTVKIATRSSKLALWQANWIKDQITAAHSGVDCELIHIKTKGDKILDTPLAKIGGKGLFVKELENALIENQADIAVHSLKDVPTELPEGLEISIFTTRATPNDALVSNRHTSFITLPQGAIIGTSSLRRIAQLKHLRPDLGFKTLRGNVPTRLAKLDAGDYDAIILAAAGLVRLELKERITEFLPVDISLPAIGQGTVAIESRCGDVEILNILAHLNDAETTSDSLAERAFLCRLNGGCQVPLAGFAETQNNKLTLTGLLASPDGKQFLKMTRSGPVENCQEIGVELAEELLAAGGREILSLVGIEVS